MFAISLLYKVFMIITIFTLIYTCVSTKEQLYQMVKKDQNFEAYRISSTKIFEKKLSVEELYHTLYNFDHKRIPEPFKKYDYEEYQRALFNYCDYEYVSLDYFTRQCQIQQFKDAILSMRSCIKQDPKNNENNYNTCIKMFKTQISSIKQEKKHKIHWFWMKKKDDNEAEENLAKIVHQNTDLEMDDIQYPLMFKSYTNLEDVQTTNEDRQYCKSQINAFNSVLYTIMKMAYMIFPGLSMDFSELVKRRKQIIRNLQSIDLKNSSLYNDLRLLNVKISIDYYNRLKKRRAVIEEKNYVSYVLRMNLRGYFPLPQYLWKKEQSILKKNYIQGYIATEYNDDLSINNQT